jgi:hypothetical protein
MNTMRTTLFVTAALHIAAAASAQTPDDPFPTPLEATNGVIRLDYREFAVIPDVNGQAPRMNLLVDEPGSRRLFLNDMRGQLYAISYDGNTVAVYVDINDAKWGRAVHSGGRERGFQSFAFHPDFTRRGAPGYGKFYTWTDVADTVPAPDFTPLGGGNTHDEVLLEWTARDAMAATYDGDAPRQLIRLQHPYGNHNGGMIAFNPLARQGTPDYGMLYIGNADGGSGGDPNNHAQNLGSIFGKILRIDPLGKNSPNGAYGIPADNPFVARASSGARAEIYALGVRNPQRFGWDPSNGAMYVADIGQNMVEELSPVTKGANLGWNQWEASFGFSSNRIDTSRQRGDPAITYPIAEYDHRDPILQRGAAVTGVIVYRATQIPQLRGRIIFGDNPSGEVFHVSADNPPRGGAADIRRVLLNHNGEAKTLLQLIQEKNTQQGKQPATRADLRFGTGPNGQVFLLNKADGVVRLLVAPGR